MKLQKLSLIAVSHNFFTRHCKSCLWPLIITVQCRLCQPSHSKHTFSIQKLISHDLETMSHHYSVAYSVTC